MSEPYRFCPRCATPLEPRMRGGRSRATCGACGFIHYRNPAVGVAVLVRDDSGRALLVRRAPGQTRAGLWCVPCGYVEWGEEVRDAARREVLEETGLEVRLGEVVFVASNSHDRAALTVGIWFAGEVSGGTLGASDDADEVGWFPVDALPPLAFPTDAALFEALGRAAAS